MAIFGQSNKKATIQPVQPKGRSVFGTLFGPDIGASLRPLGESGTVFVTLVAMIFASSGLFPRNHPALTGKPNTPRLRFQDVIGTAWKNLSFTKEGVPRVLMFFAVVGSIVLSCLVILLAFLSLFISHAHAQTVGVTCSNQSFFSPCDTKNDIALGWLNYIFKGQTLSFYKDPTGQIIPQSTAIQGALLTALAFYSNAILIVAAIVLFYHLASMVVETAHHGVVMGKRANQIWAPIRLVVAVGLLVPVGSGLNCGQMIAIQIAEWGSGLASQTWAVFLGALIKDSSTVVTPTTPYARKVVEDFVQIEACACAYNLLAGVTGDNSSCVLPQGATLASYSSASAGGTSITQVSPVEMQKTANLSGGGIKYIWDHNGPDYTSANNGLCGHYSTPPQAAVDPNDTIATMMQSTTLTAQTTVLQDMRKNVQSYVGATLPQVLPGIQNAPALPRNDAAFEKLVNDYQSALQTLLANSLGDFSSQLQTVADTSVAQGWVSAGAWFNTIARAQEEVMDTDAFLPQTQAPSPAEIRQRGDSIFQGVPGALTAYNKWLDLEDPSTTYLAANMTSSGLSTTQAQLMDAAAGFTQNGGQNNNWMDVIFAVIDWFASWNKVWTPQFSTLNGVVTDTPNTSDFTLGVMFTGQNPLAQIAFFGHACINTAYLLFDDYIKFTFAGGLASGLGENAANTPPAEQHILDANRAYVGSIITSGKSGSMLGTFLGPLWPAISGAAGAGGAVATGIGTIMGFISTIFFTIGILLAYYLPLLPFMRFLFSTLTWVVAVLESVIAMPLVALAHLNPEGDGLPGANGKAAYYFIFNIFLKPVLMVFGLILGLMIFFVAASMMNMLYMQAVVGTGGISHGHVTLARLVYSVLYVTLLYMCANNSFKLVTVLPEHAMKWMGGQSLNFHQMGDPQQMATYTGIISQQADQKLITGAGTGLRTAGQALSGKGGLIGTGVGAAAFGLIESGPKGMNSLAKALETPRNGSGAAASTGGSDAGSQLAGDGGLPKPQTGDGSPPPSTELAGNGGMPEPQLVGDGGSPRTQLSGDGGSPPPKMAGDGGSPKPPPKG